MELDIPHERWKEAVSERSSRRRYLSDPVSEDDISILEDIVDRLQGTFPLADVRVHRHGFEDASKNFIGSYGLVTGASSYAVVTGRTGEDDYLAHIQAGALGEGLILEATSLGLNTCWMGGFYDEDEVISRSEMGEEEEVLAITPLGEAKRSVSLTEKVVKTTVGSGRRKKLDELCTEKFFKKSWDWMETAVELARLAPSAMNRQPWRFDVVGDGLILRTAYKTKKYGVYPYLDCGTALLHLLIGARCEGVEPSIKYGEPPIIAVINP